MTIQLNSRDSNTFAIVLGSVFMLSLAIAFNFSLQQTAPVNAIGLFGGLIPGIAGLLFTFLLHIPNVWSERQTQSTGAAIAQVVGIIFFLLLFGGMSVSGFADLF